MAKKKSKRVNFSKYKPIYDRGFNPAYMEQLQDSLIARDYPEAQRLAFLASALHESGGNPRAVDATGDFKGLYQWSMERFPNTWDLGKQIHYALESAESKDTKSSWTHGGGGIPKINNALEGRDAFWNSIDPYEATLYFNKGYVRPAEEEARINRAEEAANMSKNLFLNGGFTDTDYDNYVYNPNYGLDSVFSPVSSPISQDVLNDIKEGKKRKIIDVPALDENGNPIDVPLKKAYDFNGILNKGMAGLSGAMDIAQSTMANAKIKDTAGIQTAIDAAANTTFGGSTNEQLLAQYDALEDLDRTSQRDLTGSVGSKLANTGKATLSGVQAGMQIGGPIGGIIGGVVGLGASIGGWIIGDTKAQNEADRLNREAEAAEQRRLANFDLAVNNLKQQNLMYEMANYAKYGGPLFNEFSNGITKINEGGSHEFIVGQEYEVSDEEIKLLKKLGYEFEYI